MIYGSRISPDADLDLDDIFMSIGEDSGEAALRFLVNVERTFDLICQQPLAYARYPFDSPHPSDLRKCSVIGFENHLVFFRIDADMVEFVRVVHGSRNIQALFDENH